MCVDRNVDRYGSVFCGFALVITSFGLTISRRVAHVPGGWCEDLGGGVRRRGITSSVVQELKHVGLTGSYAAVKPFMPRSHDFFALLGHYQSQWEQNACPLCEGASVSARIRSFSFATAGLEKVQ
jgi:hypothetical protein